MNVVPPWTIAAPLCGRPPLVQTGKEKFCGNNYQPKQPALYPFPQAVRFPVVPGGDGGIPVRQPEAPPGSGTVGGVNFRFAVREGHRSAPHIEPGGHRGAVKR